MIKLYIYKKFKYKNTIMNATPNLNNWLVNIDAIALETKKLEAKKEILQNIQDFALLFQRIQEASNMAEFDKIVSEDAEAANDSSFNETPKITKASNDSNYKIPEPVNITLEDDTTSDLVSEPTEVISDEISEAIEPTKSITPKYEDNIPSLPKIKLNLTGWFGKAANSWNDEEEEDKKAA